MGRKLKPSPLRLYWASMHYLATVADIYRLRGSGVLKPTQLMLNWFLIWNSIGLRSRDLTIAHRLVENVGELSILLANARWPFMPNIAITERAETAMSSLGLADRNRVVGSIDRLRGGNEPHNTAVISCPRPQRQFIICIKRHTQTLRVIFSIDADVVVIQDVVNHDIISRYFQNGGLKMGRKVLENFHFSPSACRKELSDLEELLKK